MPPPREIPKMLTAHLRSGGNKVSTRLTAGLFRGSALLVFHYRLIRIRVLTSSMVSIHGRGLRRGAVVSPPNSFGLLTDYVAVSLTVTGPGPWRPAS